MNELTLVFTPRPEAKLYETIFKHSGGVVKATLGSEGGCFKWSLGVKALTFLFLRTAVYGRRSAGNGRPGTPVLEGKRRSLASCLNDVLTSSPAWLKDMFDTPYRATDMIKRRNADFNTTPGGNVELWLDEVQMPSDRIRVLVKDREVEAVEDVGRLEELAEDIQAQWERGGRRQVRAASPRQGDAGLGGGEGSDSLRDGVTVTTVEIVLKRDFDSYLKSDELQRLIETIRRLLDPSEDIRVKSIRRGSVLLTLELTSEQAKKLLRAAEAGGLADFGVVDARRLPPPPADSSEVPQAALLGYDHQPVPTLLREHARWPVGWLGRVAQWAKRRPAEAALVFPCLALVLSSAAAVCPPLCQALQDTHQMTPVEMETKVIQSQRDRVAKTVPPTYMRGTVKGLDVESSPITVIICAGDKVPTDLKGQTSLLYPIVKIRSADGYDVSWNRKSLQEILKPGTPVIFQTEERFGERVVVELRLTPPAAY